MLLAVLSVCSEEELEDTSSDEDDTRTIADLGLTPSEIAQRRQQIKNKILAVGRMQRVFQILRCVTLAIFILCNLVNLVAFPERRQKMHLSLLQLTMPIHWAYSAQWEKNWVVMLLGCKAIR
jgi:hypothetical protein